ncbi:hypothetical protein HanRHA438_Chr02g0065331 [Helianthus annuus]|uniref:Uncharacterized protein n=1 Tax=Helianthus annuus TaxID=4232 RepID=A0A251VFJ0_HELAN|nr:hypothetical protein HanXRQr2_Chr02g0064171 [Helianthus annuus]KAJ0604656.1 hypothetical protein HanHA300_Chr02g0052621 [Helianthus annuus]KAJ0939799.1 hypothetical protein HanRHA438_Chr02g0065331 [Helianthus annuus]
MRRRERADGERERERQKKEGRRQLDSAAGEFHGGADQTPATSPATNPTTAAPLLTVMTLFCCDNDDDVSGKFYDTIFLSNPCFSGRCGCRFR